MSIERYEYTQHYGMEPTNDGIWVYYADYQELEERLRIVEEHYSRLLMATATVASRTFDGPLDEAYQMAEVARAALTEVCEYKHENTNTHTGLGNCNCRHCE